MSEDPTTPVSKDRIVPPARWRVLLTLGVVAFGAATVAGLGVVERARSMQEVGAWTEAQAIPTVHVVQASRGPENQELSLPGTIQAYTSGALYARASGYITSWTHDIGAHVKKDEVLATISSPELDAQLAQARATLAQLHAAQLQAQADADLSTATNKRTARLVTQGWSSEERGDTDRFTAESRKAAVEVAKANIVAQQAAVERLENLASFEKITAPFDGVVTTRTIDIGDLVTADGKSGRAMFQVADIHRMRVYVNVPQAFLEDMRPGLKATLAVVGKHESFAAEVVSTSNALAEGSRTALVQLQCDNPDGKLWPGAFTSVQFHIPSDPETLRIPTTALVFAKHGIQVAVVGADHTIELRNIVLGRNLGTDVEVRKGIDLADRLVDNPQESTTPGERVRLAGEPEPDDAAVSQSGAAPAPPPHGS